MAPEEEQQITKENALTTPALEELQDYGALEISLEMMEDENTASTNLQVSNVNLT